MTSSRAKRHYLVSDNNRQYVIAVEAVSAAGIAIEPMLILPGKLHLERFYQDLGDDILVGLSDTGYANDELTFTYIQHFERQSRLSQKGAHRTLLCDGYKSHLTAEVLEFCEFWKIHIFAFPPHATHFL
jgi:DDE superfamily endonuclease